LLAEGFISNTFEPWKIPDTSSLQPMEVRYAQPRMKDYYHPYLRNKWGSRPWAIPGTPDLQHRVGGLERDLDTGDVSSDGDNHEKMVRLRAEKIRNIQEDIPLLEVDGPSSGKLLVLGWGGTEGAIDDAVDTCRSQGMEVARAHLFYLNPFPRNLGEVLASYETVLVPEVNDGQLAMLLQSEYLRKIERLSRVNAEPVKVSEIVSWIAVYAGQPE